MAGDCRQDRPNQLAGALLRPAILAYLLDRSGYGYELRGQLRDIGLECDLGTVYRALNAMEGEGLLHSTWERSSRGRSRRRYELNDAGAQMVEVYFGAVEQLLGVANAFIEMHHRGNVSGARSNGDGLRDTFPFMRETNLVGGRDGAGLHPFSPAESHVVDRSLTGAMRPLRVLPARRPGNARVGAVGSS